MTIFIETFLFLNHYHHLIGLACKVCLQNVSICPCTKPIITIKLLWCTTVVATFLSLNSYEDEKFEKKGSYHHIQYTVMFTHQIDVFCIFDIQKFN